ncbi:Mannose-P-dolichol utilization defect 1 protein-like [Citrus sinensis]|nr:Mannose-P-dolichol utilization defect 1 protein-like [Citrus sinensis]
MDYLGINIGCVTGSLRDGKFPEKDCLLPLLSKILKILKHRSASGISATTFELEVVAATIGLGYSIQKGIPFSAYGEVFFILIQGLILVAITYYYSQPVGTATWIRALLHASISHFYLPGSLKYGRTLKRQMGLSNLENDQEIAAADRCS